MTVEQIEDAKKMIDQFSPQTGVPSLD